MGATRKQVPAPTPVRALSTAEVVARHLRNQIVRNELKPGDELPTEQELMRRFGVSRPTLREAVHILKSESLLTVSRGAKGGSQIHRPAVSTVARYAGFVLQTEGASISDLYLAHRVLEPPVVRLVTETASKTAVPALSAVLRDLEAALGDDAAFAEVTAEFQRVLFEQSGNRTLMLLIGLINGVINRHLAAATTTHRGLRDTMPDKLGVLENRRLLIELIGKSNGAAAHDFWLKAMEAEGKVIAGIEEALRLIDVID